MPFVAAGAVTGIGSLPLTSVTSAVRAVAEFSPEVPFWPQLPQLSQQESIVSQGLGVVENLIAPRNEGYGYQVKAGQLDSVLEILHRSSGELTPAHAAGFGAFEEALSSGLFGSAIAVKGQIEGPITLSAYLFHKGRHFLADPALFAAVAFHVSQIIGWQIDRLKLAGLHSGLMHWQPHLSTLAFVELMPDCIAARRAPLSACAACNPTSSPSMPMKDWTGSLPIGMRWTSCNKVEP
jgi:hypothetical protein